MKIILCLAILLLLATSPIYAQAPCTSTPNVGLQLPNIGNTTNWGMCVNNNMLALDTILGGDSQLARNSATPTITGYKNWVTNSSAATTITNFVGGYEGQQINIVSGDALTSIVSDVTIEVNAPWTSATSKAISFVDIGGVWYETGRSGSVASVSSVGLTVPSWLVVAGSPITSYGVLAITPASGQTSHQVIGTCGTATAFGPCVLVIGDLPTGIPNANLLNPSTTVNGQVCMLGSSCSIAAGVTTVFGRSGAVVATSGDYSVGLVTGAAPLASPAFTGVPTAPTASAGTNTTQIASTAFVIGEIGAPGTLYSVAGTALPSCTSSINGQEAVVSDATSPTYMGAYSGSGGITTAVICSYNGSTHSWKTH